MSLHYLGKRGLRKWRIFSYAVYCVSKTKWLGEKKYLHTVLNKHDCTVYKKLLKLVDECQRYSKPRQCRFQDTVHSMTEKTQFPGLFLFPQVVQKHYLREVR